MPLAQQQGKRTRSSKISIDDKKTLPLLSGKSITYFTKSNNGFIKTHRLFIKEIFIKTEDKKQIVRIVRKSTPSLEERGLSHKDVMQKAKRGNNDEFYTRYEDVEKELSMYSKRIWKNKVVFCNCDDAVDDKEKNTSAFALYFLQNFKELGLKKT